jgi:phosphoribosylamine--glycine ligase
MKVLIVGGGGREDALTWALARSPEVDTLNVAPGNAGTPRHATRVAIGAEDVDGLVEHALAEAYDLVVVGPEAPLCAGLADRLREAGAAVFGPDAAAAEIEGSKVFAKQFMKRHGIPTAGYRVFDDADAAERWLRSTEAFFPLVLKADGLAAGKGVILTDDLETAVDTARGMLQGESFGNAGRRVVIEEQLRGREASFFVLSDGERFVELATCQDYKRASDGDAGPNTGGMGTYSPSAFLDGALRARLLETIVSPTIAGLAAEGRPYRGVLYVGVMLTDDGPQVLEYNARFGDPETQVLLPRLDGDWLPLLLACARGELGDAAPRWRSESAVCVVLAAGGYPGSYTKGHPIEGLDAAESLDDVIVFHAGTAHDERQRVVTSGGRVLGVTALGTDLAAARERAYAATRTIRWEGMQHRSDIALDAVHREEAGETNR